MALLHGLRWLTYSPAAIDMAPATRRGARPDTSDGCCDLCSAAATPTIRLAVETMPSFAPSTAARSQPMRATAWRSMWGLLRDMKAAPRLRTIGRRRRSAHCAGSGRYWTSSVSHTPRTAMSCSTPILYQASRSFEALTMMKCSCGFTARVSWLRSCWIVWRGAQHPHVAGGAGHLAGFAQHALEALIAGEQARGDEIVADRNFGLAGVEARDRRTCVSSGP